MVQLVFSAVLVIAIASNPILAHSKHRQKRDLSMIPNAFVICLRGVEFVTKASNLDNYNTLNYQWNTVNYIEPMGYLVPKNTTQVQTSVKCCVAAGIRFVAKSGGHSYEKYSFGNASTIVIDLINLNSVDVDPGLSTASIGPGVLNSHLFYGLWKQGNYVTAGGFCVAVGYGGSTLGGGYGWLSQKYGLIIDNLLGMTVVTYDGVKRIVTANRYDDLYWALRGGGAGNFGIVTNYMVKVYSGAGLQYNFITLEFPISDFITVFTALQQFYLKNTERSTFCFAVLKNTGINVDLFDINLTPAEVRGLINQFPDPAKETTKTLPRFVDVVIQRPASSVVTKVEDLKDYKRTQGDKQFAKIKSYYVSKVISPSDVMKLDTVFQRIPPKCTIFLESFSGLIATVSKNATAFIHRNALYTLELKTGSNSSAVLGWLSDFKRVMLLLDNGESYQNLNDGTLTDYLKRYYGSALPRLQAIKTKYDPFNYFNYGQSIPPSKK